MAGAFKFVEETNEREIEPFVAEEAEEGKEPEPPLNARDMKNMAKWVHHVPSIL